MFLQLRRLVPCEYWSVMYYGMERSTYQWQLHATALRPWMSLNIVTIKYHLSSHPFSIFRPFLAIFAIQVISPVKQQSARFLADPQRPAQTLLSKFSQYLLITITIITKPYYSIAIYQLFSPDLVFARCQKVSLT